MNVLYLYKENSVEMFPKEWLLHDSHKFLIYFDRKVCSSSTTGNDLSEKVAYYNTREEFGAMKFMVNIAYFNGSKLLKLVNNFFWTLR